MKVCVLPRVLIGLLFPLGIFLACYAAFHPQDGIGCLFFKLTGLYCPGCGSGRAISALLRGEIKAAFSYNPLVILLGAPSFVVFTHEYLRYVFPDLPLRPVYISRVAAITLVVVITAFWVLRNTQAFSFLAP